MKMITTLLPLKAPICILQNQKKCLITVCSDYKMHFPSKFGRKWGCILQSECSLPGWLGYGGGRGGVFFFFLLFSSSKTQVHLMVWCILYSNKYSIQLLRKTHLELTKYTQPLEKKITTRQVIRLQETFHIFCEEKFMKPINQFVGSHKIKRTPYHENKGVTL